VFNLQGTCTYTLSKTNLMKGTRLVPFTVLAENYNQKSSVTKGVTLDVYGFNLVLRNTVSGVLVSRAICDSPEWRVLYYGMESAV
jgi:hypothetical protein